MAATKPSEQGLGLRARLGAAAARTTGVRHRSSLCRVAYIAGASALALSQPAFAQVAGDWQIRTATLAYAETDRVQAIEPVISATRYLENDRIWSSKLVVDVLTGASANGAVPSDQAQTFTRPSGEGVFVVEPGQIVLDDTFRDTRIALSTNWTQPLGTRMSGTFGINASNEYDYQSLGLSSVLNYNFNRKNTMLSVGANAAVDSISPEGGVPTPFAEVGWRLGRAPSGDSGQPEDQFDDDLERAARGGTEDKTVIDLLLGVTQVIDRLTILQLNLSFTQADGYLTDPFKMVSEVDPESGQPTRQLYELRPDSRSKQALFARVKRQFFGRDIGDLSYRFQTDDWGMTSHTLDLRYRHEFRDGRQFVQPHVRFYQQSAVDFYAPFLLEGQSIPEVVSADYRLGEFTGLTLGFEYGRQTGRLSGWRAALEYYLQTGPEPDAKPGQLAQQEVYPDVEAVMFRVNYDFGL